jgi:polar amino acid transport system substrate-binding protein
VAGRILGLIWMFVAIIIISSFTAAITSSLTVTQLESVIKGPEDLPKVTVGTTANTTSESYLNQIQSPFRSYGSPQEGLAALKEGKVQALVYDAPILRCYIHKNISAPWRCCPTACNARNTELRCSRTAPCASK